MENADYPGTSAQRNHMWISKPIYESLPFVYLFFGVISLAASMYIDHWYWPTISFATGMLCLVAGMVVLLKRRDSRSKLRRGQKN